MRQMSLLIDSFFIAGLIDSDIMLKIIMSFVVLNFSSFRYFFLISIRFSKLLRKVNSQFIIIAGISSLAFLDKILNFR